MSKFKVGDIVTCIREGGCFLTEGRAYCVAGTAPHEVRLKNDLGGIQCYPSTCFKLTEPQDDEPTEALAELMQDTSALKNNTKDCKPPRKYVHKDLKDQTALAHLGGEIKYEAFNYMKGHKLTDLLDAMERHIDLIRQGEDIDTDTTQRLRDGGTNQAGKHYPGWGENAPEVTHLGCIGANLNMIFSQLAAGTLIDDRDDYLKYYKG